MPVTEPLGVPPCRARLSFTRKTANEYNGMANAAGVLFRNMMPLAELAQLPLSARHYVAATPNRRRDSLAEMRITEVLPANRFFATPEA